MFGRRKQDEVRKSLLSRIGQGDGGRQFDGMEYGYEDIQPERYELDDENRETVHMSRKHEDGFYEDLGAGGDSGILGWADVSEEAGSDYERSWPADADDSFMPGAKEQMPLWTEERPSAKDERIPDPVKEAPGLKAEPFDFGTERAAESKRIEPEKEPVMVPAEPVEPENTKAVTEEELIKGGNQTAETTMQSADIPHRGKNNPNMPLLDQAVLDIGLGGAPSALVNGRRQGRARKNVFSEETEENSGVLYSPEEEAVVDRVRTKVKEKLGDRIKSERKDPGFQEEVRGFIEDCLKTEASVVKTVAERRRVTERILNLIVGYGPLEKLFKSGYSEIMVSRFDKIYVEKNGKLVLSDIRFASEEELKNVIVQMVTNIGREINDANPIVDGRLEDGSRFNAVLSPIAVDGAQLTIRRFPEKKLVADDYIKFGSMDKQILWFLKQAVRSKYNLVVSGGTGSGKTSLLNLLSNFLDYDPGLSVVTIEDSCELKINHPNVRRYETRNENSNGSGEITSRMLVKNLMRVRPDVAIIGEIRDGTMADFLRLNTSGHEGGMTTVHNNSPEELEGTIQVLFKMAKDYEFSENTISRLYANAVDLIVQIKRYPDHGRRISHISHVVGYGEQGARALNIPYDSPEYNPQRVYIRDIFRWEMTGKDENGKFIGEFRPTGYVPEALLEKSYQNGVEIDRRIFSGELRIEGEVL